jgi:hypothetical protein
MPLLRHETGIEQDAEVLGDGWAAHLEMSCNRVYGALGLKEEIEHPATRGMANCPKDIRLAIGSHQHESRRFWQLAAMRRCRTQRRHTRVAMWGCYSPKCHGDAQVRGYIERESRPAP